MPECKSCGNDFHNSITIDRKRKFLHKRSYCLDCSPLGTRPDKYRISFNISKDENGNISCLCNQCGNKFIWKHGTTTREKCHSCIVKEIRNRKKIKAVELMGGKCSVCGYNRILRALHFHHLNTDEKVGNISRLYDKTWEEMKKELDKCILLCAN